MIGRILILMLLILGACAPAAATPPAATPFPTSPILPTLAPVGATILPSDRKGALPTLDATQEARAPTLAPTQPPVPTPAAVGFDYALRPQFLQDFGRVENKTVYTIEWELNEDLSEIQGTQRVIFANRTGEPLKEIYFRLFANYPNGDGSIEIDNLRVAGEQVDEQLEAEGTALRVPLSRPLAPNRVLPMTLDYTIRIPTNNQSRYTDFTRNEWITTLPTVYPLIPAFDDKGWHTEVPPPYGDLVYADSSIYDVTITTPSEYQVIASGQLVQETNEGARTTRRFIGAPMRDFDVNLTNALEMTPAQVDDVTVNSWYLPEHSMAGEQALDWTVNAMRVYEDRFGAYPFKELDLVETPTSAGGIEYPGLITVASKLYGDTGQLAFFEFATAHEVAHQWFYSTIGNDQVNHPWLDEALAQYATLMYFEDRYGKETARGIQESYFDAAYETAKQKYGDKPSGLPVRAYDENAYGAFVYSKGPKFFQAVRDQIGDEAFFGALRDYYDVFKFRIATPSDLVAAFNTASGQDISALYKQWIGE